MRALFLLLVLKCLSATELEPDQFDDQQMVDYLNKKQSLFKAELPKMSYNEFASRIMDPKFLRYANDSSEKTEIDKNYENIPESFDAREEWPGCDSIRIIRDQANCNHGSWAVASASAMSDRLCVQSDGEIKSLVSDTDILACCGLACGFGCEGGYLDMAWEYVIRKGACTGGLYRQKGVCKPYPFHPCGEHKGQPYYGECSDQVDAPRCRHQCQIRYGKKYHEDKIYALSRYNVRGGEPAMQKEIMENGPIIASMIVFSDFRFYKSGIYRWTSGVQVGVHGVKIIGWGVENGVKYWIVSNSWSSDWGENGYFRILRGVSECAIEDWAYAGMMKV